ncbi:hypothetical protein [Arthrobacter sp. PAMC25284]|uniref:hypothetical protein n=1 Tax=Arthrobacter sp. PAMC25284 TaxID=2861279 RepID=UPI001C626F60|nr:hypothetical protein [Arthrobacter sp. PAMC25284]QYF88482.1 hypothetical protein KY499_09280 [Arthrobacter sp. PAMC25284]
MPPEISNDSTGRFLITTATGSQYVLDMDARAVSRKMAATVPLTSFLDVGVARLRRDDEPLELIMLEHCAVGQPARFWLQIRDDHIPTLRTTSPVVRIEPLPAHK